MSYSSKSATDKKRILKIVKVLREWEDADIFSLDVKKLIAIHIVDELENEFGHERGF
tara:strand:- start:10540 stop:10710 length:171 start_codon:yes stop_codon:yes gene_type:complete